MISLVESVTAYTLLYCPTTLDATERFYIGLDFPSLGCDASQGFPSVCEALNPNIFELMAVWCHVLLKKGAELYLRRSSSRGSRDEDWLLCDLSILRTTAHQYPSQRSSVTRCTAAGRWHHQDEYLSKSFKGRGNNLFITENRERPKTLNSAWIQTHSLSYMK